MRQFFEDDGGHLSMSRLCGAMTIVTIIGAIVTALFAKQWETAKAFVETLAFFGGSVYGFNQANSAIGKMKAPQ